jgi:RNA polymerase sigma factor (sigma-70 family)
MKTDYELLHGGSEDFKALYDKYSPQLLNFIEAMQLVHCGFDKPEVMQLIWVRVLQKKALCDERYSFRNWLYQIAVRVALNFYRDERSEMFGVYDNPKRRVPEPSETLIEKELQEIVREAVAQLPPDERESVELTYLDQSEPTHGRLRSPFRRARKKLRKSLKGYANEI